MKKCMWEILVPTIRPGAVETKERFSTAHHREWDKNVRGITHGLTIMTPAKGQWLSPSGELFIERMIPVRIVGTRAEIERIIWMTLDHYTQEAVLCYKISDEVILQHALSK